MDRVQMPIQLAGMLINHMDKPAWPGIDDPAVTAKCAKWTKKSGAWDIGQEESPAQRAGHARYFQG
jgi:hypothetical protein